MYQNTNLSQQLLAWYDRFGRKNLPWKNNQDPYPIWLSEIMLQQTQVTTVIPYFERFTTRFPTIESLAKADDDEVMQLWSGLGYYTRARNLHRCAQCIVNDHGGKFPNDIDALQALPGIGRSTAAAILAQAYDAPHAILDGNVKRVLSRFHAIEGWPGKKSVENQLWILAEQHTPNQRVADYTQAIMDLGATCCTRSRPQCSDCPLHANCQAFQTNSVDCYPFKKPKKSLPTKSTQLIMATHDNQHYLLYKRPPSGIWGGLWSFPECPLDTELTSWAHEQGFLVEEICEWPTFRHTFSHYHLEIHPRKLIVTDAEQIHDHHQALWLDIQHQLTVGTATPVTRLLDELKRQHSSKG